jgi:hypothetical protein
MFISLHKVDKRGISNKKWPKTEDRDEDILCEIPSSSFSLSVNLLNL